MNQLLIQLCIAIWALLFALLGLAGIFLTITEVIIPELSDLWDKFRRNDNEGGMP